MSGNKANNKSKKGGKKNNKSSSTAMVMLPNKPAMQAAKPTTTLAVRSSSRKEKICSMADPFCVHAMGARWLDGQTFSTIPYRVRSHKAYLASTNGSFLVDFNPQFLPFASLEYSYVGGIFTANNTYYSVTGTTNLSTYFAGSRPVTAGIVIRNLASVMNTSGYLIISRVLAPTTLSTGTVTAGSMLYASVYTVPVVPGMEVAVVHMPIGVNSRDFTPIGTSSTTQWADQTWDTIRVEGVGLYGASNSLDIEVFYNYEMQPLNNNPISQTISPAIQGSVRDVEAAQHITNTVGQRVWDGVKKLGAFVEKVAGEAAVAVAVSRFGGPNAGNTMAGRGRGLIVDVD